MASTSPRSLTALPREIRDLVYTALFQSLVFDGSEAQSGSDDGARDTRLAILYACRQIHAEASPLVLRHVRIFCAGASDMLRVLMALSPAQIRQLKYLRVDYNMLCLELPRSEDGKAPAEDAEFYGFHVGALLGLFPGLELDLLELTDGMHGGLSSFSCYHAPDLIASLLRADGWREARAALSNLDFCFPGSFEDRGQECFRADAAGQLDACAALIRSRFRPRPGARVDLYYDETAAADAGYWERHRAAGFALAGGLAARDEARRDAPCGDDELRYWNFRACRGAGPCAVRAAGEAGADDDDDDDDEEQDDVLECVQSHFMGPAELRDVSRHLRRFVKQADWATIDRAQEESGMYIDGPYGEEPYW